MELPPLGVVPGAQGKTYRIGRNGYSPELAQSGQQVNEPGCNARTTLVTVTLRVRSPCDGARRATAKRLLLPKRAAQKAERAMAIPTVTEATFEQEVLTSQLPVLVDLYADWCAPCKVLEPRVAEIAREYEGQLKVVKINVDQSPRLAQMFQARSIPMLVLIVGGRVAGALQGAVPKHDIVDLITPYLPGATEEVPAKELAELLKARRVVVLDVRDAGSYRRAHIPGAVNIPFNELEGRIPELFAARRPVVVYDRAGGDDAKNAVKLIEAKGLPAMPLKGGFLGWETEGLDVVKPS